MSELHLDWCSQKAARHAVMRWHYSRKMPASKLVRVGVWEENRFRGAILYGVGANRHLARPFRLEKTQACELVRVALAPGREHPTSKCVALSLRLLRHQSPGLRLVVSYADLGREHLGTIYQAGNWLYLGPSNQCYLRVLGEIVHPRSLYDRYGAGGQSLGWLQSHVDPRAERVPMAPKLKYVYPFHKKLRRELAKNSHPYPKSAAEVTPATRSGTPRERAVQLRPGRSNAPERTNGR